jgi:hypothetical protein
MKTNRKIAFGDFQTPDELARAVVLRLAQNGIRPASIVEPTCGRGSILGAAVEHFPDALVAYGLDVNADHLAFTQRRFRGLSAERRVKTRPADFFTFHWPSFFGLLPEPILVIGNPPWVTAAELGALQSGNLPVKSNFQNHKGCDAVTGKSNFDIAEWMLIHLVECLRDRQATVGMLVKTATARKLLQHAWKWNLPITDCQIHNIDAMKYFNVSVNACLFICNLSHQAAPRHCPVFDLGVARLPSQLIGYHNDALIADETAFHELSHLQVTNSAKAVFRWRSGIKHDCSKVMELRVEPGALMNGLNRCVEIEETYLYPMLKGSEVARDGDHTPTRLMIVPQRLTSDPTDEIAWLAPRTWQYLASHSSEFEARGSSIYKNRPPFCIFGVGPYTFAPWKVAICGLYKKIAFAVIGPHSGKPVVLDDTCYHLSFQTEDEARKIAEILNSALVRRFFEAFVFWDAKRAITVDLLRRLDISAAAKQLGVHIASGTIDPPPKNRRKHLAAPMPLFS